MSKLTNTYYSTSQLFSLTLLRVLIGWHFLYEGMVKLFSNPGWSAKGYLINSVGPLSSQFKTIASNPAILTFVDKLNIWGLILIGVSLFLGIFTKISKVSGIILLLLYYLAYPPLAKLNILTDGHFWIVNYNFIEIGALYVLWLFPSSQLTGIDKFIQKYKNK